MLKSQQSLAMPKISSSWLVMPSQYCHQSVNLLQNKLCIISILDILPKLLVLNKVLNNPLQLSQLASAKLSCQWALKFMLIYYSKKFTSMMLTSGSLTLDGPEEDTESEKEFQLKILEILLTLSTMVESMIHNMKLSQFSILNIQRILKVSIVKFLTQPILGRAKTNTMKL